MRDILPEPVLDDLREHYYDGVKDAEVKYRFNVADENSLTGALGHALITPDVRVVELNGRAYSWRSEYHRVGPKAEKRIGADGIFELAVLDEFGKVLRRKGLLFQAKKEWTGANQDLLAQVTQMEKVSPSAVVIDYGPTGYTAVPGSAVIDAKGNRRAIPPQDQFSLAEVLRDFAFCERGDVGLFWNPKKRILERAGGAPVARPMVPSHVISTTVRRRRRRAVQ